MLAIRGGGWHTTTIHRAGNKAMLGIVLVTADNARNVGDITLLREQQAVDEYISYRVLLGFCDGRNPIKPFVLLDNP